MTTSQYVTITFGGQYIPPPLPTCSRCQSVATKRADLDGSLWCDAHFEDFAREVTIANAEQWITAVFLAVVREQRPRAYKNLAAIFHPDQGGDPALMVALNRVRDRFR